MQTRLTTKQKIEAIRQQIAKEEKLENLKDLLNQRVNMLSVVKNIDNRILELLKNF